MTILIFQEFFSSLYIKAIPREDLGNYERHWRSIYCISITFST